MIVSLDFSIECFVCGGLPKFIYFYIKKLSVELCLAHCANGQNLILNFFHANLFQLVVTCSKSTMETPKQCMKSVKVNSKDTRSTSVVWFLKLHRFHTFSWFFQLLTLNEWMPVGMIHLKRKFWKLMPTTNLDLFFFLRIVTW